jgi:hypothetical protein
MGLDQGNFNAAGARKPLSSLGFFTLDTLSWFFPISEKTARSETLRVRGRGVEGVFPRRWVLCVRMGSKNQLFQGEIMVILALRHSFGRF